MVGANIPAELAALPIESLIGKPLEAAVRAQAFAAMTTARFVQEVGLDDDGNVKTVTFKFKRKELDPETGDVTDVDTTVEAPLLTILPVPFIRIKDMTVHFNFTIKTSAQDKTQHDFASKLTAKAGWGWGSVKLTASYGFKKESRSQVDRSSELDITVNAVQDEMPEGMRTLLSLLKESIAPAGASGGGTG
ncbi:MULTISPECIES: DUF2589 domain-containing protein [Archaeoglobus]|jgi:hypothetical protein|uniref:Uncharacterized protein AF_0417 n=3 Tax=Archaeoglobus fulgidus TaxID=2234 RepID=Y417_ARCFU|nr:MULTISPECIES: DUF2589 domain-containing protein [Archaeoglobus]O29830.1 RecName: Full=Uncharacterized protein AF_0417 [Archaeoglobus fulgidus DSM 4304]AAB90821.1 predicted coding region AF_0417 [Archaeoglobus fulgidus DSM 4304]AIG97235.1 hypothetical protein AFULGI_00004210 [Archaeoglobus fulgidus DSM 8774]KUJ94391.1 MAG: hypothetical protein XD40_0485 [Archaeoglobus fulgidus]KUK06548.1 MAG: Uncharacterized protein XD48_1228 [Archaeoglobus fulgidus]MDI3497260.1 hypothetical protein [Archae